MTETTVRQPRRAHFRPQRHKVRAGDIWTPTDGKANPRMVLAVYSTPGEPKVVDWEGDGVQGRMRYQAFVTWCSKQKASRSISPEWEALLAEYEANG